MRRIEPTLLALGILLLAAVLLGWWRFGGFQAGSPEAAQNLAEVMGPTADAEAYARVRGPRPLRFPEDHGAHPDHRTEWWYFTGNLRGEDGRDYGFQLTLFRSALAPSKPDKDSAWTTRQAWMGHFALTDVTAGEHRASERYQRGALGLAGASVRPVRVWLDDWEILSAGPERLFPLRLQAREPDKGIAIDLRLDAVKGHVLQGDRGYSRKGNDPANASRYYSYTRLQAAGEVAFGGRETRAAGSAWLDREWSTSALDAGQQGWDWFALQLDDGRDLMVYRLRRQDGATDRFSAGILVDREGRGRPLTAADFSLVPTRHWRSPQTGSRYPVAWQLEVPSAGLSLGVEARVDDQEMPTTVRYWEGSVRVDGSASGVGYLEMTGY